MLEILWRPLFPAAPDGPLGLAFTPLRNRLCGLSSAQSRIAILILVKGFFMIFRFSAALCALALLATTSVWSVPEATQEDIQIQQLASLGNGSFRIAKDPRDNQLYVLRQNGEINRIDLSATGDSAELETVYTSADHGLSGLAGFAIGPDGSFYLTANQRGPADGGLGQISRGVPDGDQYTWTSLEANDLEGDPVLAQLTAGSRSVVDPTTDTRYLLRRGGVIGRSDASTAFTPEDHGLVSPSGIFVDDNGVFYVYTVTSFTSYNIATVVKGQPDDSGQRTWFTLAQTEPFEQCDCIFNHQVNGIAVDAANEFIYVQSGSRTDHGEVQDTDGEFPGLRETGLTTVILQLPTDARDLVVPNDRQALRDGGWLFAEGVRNTYDLAFDGDGNLFGTENSADRDMPEELNWLRQGRHYGFPWRMGNQDNPQQFPDYDPDADFLLPPGFTAVRNGYYQNDPDFPAPPTEFTDPVINLGPDADSYRDPADGQVKDASDENVVFGTFTAHRSPLGLVFDTANAMAEAYQGDGFVLSWTEGDPNGDSVNGPFMDPSEDLLHLDLEQVDDNFQARVTRLVGGFSNPIDAEIIANRIYVIEWSGGRGLWSVTLPAAPPNTAVEELAGPEPADFGLEQNYPNPFNPSTTIQFQLGAPGPVELSLYTSNGQKIRTLVDSYLEAGRFAVQWDGRDQRGQRVASGTYFYHLSAGSFKQTHQLTLLK